METFFARLTTAIRQLCTLYLLVASKQSEAQQVRLKIPGIRSTAGTRGTVHQSLTSVLETQANKMPSDESS
eukprot:scaffold38967_cov54-Attheya_sp.AAC.4